MARIRCWDHMSGGKDHRRKGLRMPVRVPQNGYHVLLRIFRGCSERILGVFKTFFP